MATAFLRLLARWRTRRTLDDALADALYRGLCHDEAMASRQDRPGRAITR
jgi:hypothetical protein